MDDEYQDGTSYDFERCQADGCAEPATFIRTGRDGGYEVYCEMHGVERGMTRGFGGSFENPSVD